jgi:hypothetical protein
MTKLKNILSEVFDEQPKVDKHEVIESVKGFGRVGQSLYGNGNIMEIAQQLSKIAESAHTHILGESDDWFDKVSVNKNMNFLKGSVKEFKKTAQEAHTLNQRLQGLYEDIGHVLNRYYDIDEEVVQEKMDPVGQEDGDIDNDGDMDSSDEYLANRRKAIGKAIKGENIGEDITMSSTAQDARKAGFTGKSLSDIGREKTKTIKSFDSPKDRRQVSKSTVFDQGGLSSAEVGSQYKSRQKQRKALNKESADARMLRLAGITKEAIEANKPTKRLEDVKDVIVSPNVVGGLNKKF